MRDIIVIAHNIRSAHNVGAILRTCDGFGISKVIYSGYTPFPKQAQDSRLPHIADKLTRDIHKTALGAEMTVTQEVVPDVHDTLLQLKEQGYRIVGLEQHEHSVSLDTYEPQPKCVLLLGEERYGLTADLLDDCDDVIEIPMRGEKESFNVSVAAGVALYHLSFM